MGNQRPASIGALRNVFACQEVRDPPYRSQTLSYGQLNIATQGAQGEFHKKPSLFQNVALLLDFIQ